MNSLETLGWDAAFAAAFAPFSAAGFEPARVITEHPGRYRLQGAFGEGLGVVAGRLRHLAVDRADFPAVGDWVAVERPDSESGAVIHGMVPRRSKVSRQAVGGGTREQILAANVDTLFLVAALNHDFNPRRLERYLGVAWESGAQPVVLLTKADLCGTTDDRLSETRAIAPGVPVHALSSLTGDGLADLAPYLAPGRTMVLLGSSGAGKSTLLNRLVGEDSQEVQAVRAGDDRGRHTTTHRELFRLPGGALVIDTPGMRELALWDSGGLATAFEDVEALVAGCRFNDCGHGAEPGCAVQAAIGAGELDAARLANYLKLERELAFQARKLDQRALLAEKERHKRLHVAHRQRPPKGA